MRQRANQSAESLLIDPSISLVRPLTASHSQTRKVSSVLLSRLVRNSSSRKLISKAPTTTRKQSPITVHTSMLLTRKFSSLQASARHGAKLQQSVKAGGAHSRAMSGEAARFFSPVVALISEDTNEDGPPSRRHHAQQAAEHLHDLLYNFSNQLSVVYNSRAKPALPLQTQLRRHRDYASHLRSDRFSCTFLARAVFQAWKSVTETQRLCKMR